MVLLVLAIEGVLLVALAVDARHPAPREVPVALVAPAVVAEDLARQAEQIDDKPFDVVASPDEGTARRDLAAGRVDAVLVVDLARTSDTLVLRGGEDARLADAIADRMDGLEQSRGRRLDVDTGEGSRIDVVRLRAAAVLSGLLGFVLVVAISWRRGAVARTLGLGLLRLSGVAGYSVLAGVAVAVLVVGVAPTTPTWQVAAVAGLATFSAAVATLGLEALFGLSGLGLSAGLFVALAMPLLSGLEPALLEPEWQAVLRWSPPGAALDAFRGLTLYGREGVARDISVLVAWSIVPVLCLGAARVVRASGSPADPRRRIDDALEPKGRRRVALTVLPVVAATVVAVVVAGHDDVATAAPPASRASETACVATGRLDSLSDLNRVADKLRGGPAFQGADVGADVELQDGRRLMMFGDTLRAEDFQGQRFVRNSMLLVDSTCLHVVLPADHGALIPDRIGSTPASTVGYWPMSVTAARRPGYDLVAVMLQRVRTTGEGSFDFQNLGPSVAVFIVGRGQTPQLLTVRDIGKDSPAVERPTWGAASALSDGWLYLYGTARSQEALTFGHSLRVARVRPEKVLEVDEWRYWDGRTWSRRAADAEELIPADGGTSQTLSVFERDGTWYALSKRDDFLGRDLTVWAAPEPTGPFDSGTALADLPSDAATGELRYMPLAHPDLLPERGTMVISYSRNRTDLQEVLEDPFAYRPRFLRVPLPDEDR